MIRIIYLVVFFVIIYISYRVIVWLYDMGYNKMHPEKKHLIKRQLKNFLVGKYGRQGKNVYKEIKRVLWRDHRIR